VQLASLIDERTRLACQTMNARVISLRQLYNKGSPVSRCHLGPFRLSVPFRQVPGCQSDSDGARDAERLHGDQERCSSPSVQATPGH
jgi:hypothetical protein